MPVNNEMIKDIATAAAKITAAVPASTIEESITQLVCSFEYTLTLLAYPIPLCSTGGLRIATLRTYYEGLESWREIMEDSMTWDLVEFWETQKRRGQGAIGPALG